MSVCACGWVGWWLGAGEQYRFSFALCRTMASDRALPCSIRSQSFTPSIFARCLQFTLPGAYDHVLATDDIDDDQAGNTAARLFASSRAQYNTLLQHMLQSWFVFLGVAILMWVALRWTFRVKIASWRVFLANQEDEWRRDLWAPTQRNEVINRRRLVDLMREG